MRRRAGARRRARRAGRLRRQQGLVPPSAAINAAERASRSSSVGAEGGFDAQKIYKDEAPGVVTIQSLFGGEGGEGSGFVLNDEGEIVTNAHVVTTGEGGAIKRASEVYVEFADGNRVAAKVLGHDPNADIALLRVEPKGLDAAAAAAGRQRAGRGRRAGRGDRVAVRPGAVAVGGDRLRGRPQRRVADRVLDLGRDPDRRGDQPRQLGRAAGRLRRPRDRRSTSRSSPAPAAARASASRCRSTSSSAPSASCARRAGPRYAYLGVSSVPLYPQLVEHFKSTPTRRVGPGDRPGRAGGERRAARRQRRTRSSRAARSPAAGT